jgi:hypothetical protein
MVNGADELDFEWQNLDRKRKLAQAMLEQSQTEPRGQMAGRVYVAPSPLQYLAQGLRQYAGMKQANEADSGMRDLMTRERGRREQEVADFTQAMQGRPAQNIPLPVAKDDDGNVMPPAVSAAVAPDRTKALAIALRSRNPALQNAGSKMLQADSERAELEATLKAFGLGPGAAGAPGTTAAPGASGAAPGPAGGIPGLDPLAAALMLRGGTLGKLGEAIQTNHKPIALREGDLVVPDGRGGFRSAYSQPKLDAGVRPVRDPSGAVVGAEQIPGYGDAVGDITRSKEGAKAGYEMVTVNTPDGPVMMTKEQAARLSGGGAPAPGNRPPAPGGQPRSAAPTPADADRVAIYNQEFRDAQQRLATARTPEERTRAQGDIDSLRRETQRLGIPLQGEQQKKFGERIAEKSADDLMEGREKARNAINELASVAEAREAIRRGAYQGSGANAKLDIAKFINANVPGVTIDPAKAGNTDYLKSLLGNGILAQAKALGANPSNADAKRIEEIVGGIDKDPQAMEQILAFREEMAIRAVEGHNRMVDDAEGRGMRAPYDLRVRPPARTPPVKGGGAVPADIDAILRKHGG